MSMNFSESAKVARENYLAEVSDELRKSLSPVEVYDSIEEMRLHLNSMASAYVELGSQPELAMESAIQKFGEPTTISQQYASESNLDFQFGLAVSQLRVQFLTGIAGACLTLILAQIFPLTGMVSSSSLSIILVGTGFGLIIGLGGKHFREQPATYVLVLASILNFASLAHVLELSNSSVWRSTPWVPINLNIILNINAVVLGWMSTRLAAERTKRTPIFSIVSLVPAAICSLSGWILFTVMIWLDFGRHVDTTELELALGIGGIGGFFIGFVANYYRGRSLTYGLLAALVANLAACWLYLTFIRFGRIDMVWQQSLWFSLIAFSVGYLGSQVKQRMNSGPNRMVRT